MEGKRWHRAHYSETCRLTCAFVISHLSRIETPLRALINELVWSVLTCRRHRWCEPRPEIRKSLSWLLHELALSIKDVRGERIHYCDTRRLHPHAGNQKPKTFLPFSNPIFSKPGIAPFSISPGGPQSRVTTAPSSGE